MRQRKEGFFGGFVSFFPVLPRVNRGLKICLEGGKVKCIQGALFIVFMYSTGGGST